jgi:hypothetical protein
MQHESEHRNVTDRPNIPWELRAMIVEHFESAVDVFCMLVTDRDVALLAKRDQIWRARIKANVCGNDYICCTRCEKPICILSQARIERAVPSYRAQEGLGGGRKGCTGAKGYTGVQGSLGYGIPGPPPQKSRRIAMNDPDARDRFWLPHERAPVECRFSGSQSDDRAYRAPFSCFPSIAGRAKCDCCDCARDVRKIQLVHRCGCRIASLRNNAPHSSAYRLAKSVSIRLGDSGFACPAVSYLCAFSDSDGSARSAVSYSRTFFGKSRDGDDDDNNNNDNDRHLCTRKWEEDVPSIYRFIAEWCVRDPDGYVCKCDVYRLYTEAYRDVKWCSRVHLQQVLTVQQEPMIDDRVSSGFRLRKERASVLDRFRSCM